MITSQSEKRWFNLCVIIFVSHNVGHLRNNRILLRKVEDSYYGFTVRIVQINIVTLEFSFFLFFMLDNIPSYTIMKSTFFPKKNIVLCILFSLVCLYRNKNKYIYIYIHHLTWVTFPNQNYIYPYQSVNHWVNSVISPTKI